MKQLELMSELTLKEKENINGGCANALPREDGSGCIIGIPDFILHPGGIFGPIWGCGCR
ncbi:hypothetical protein [Bacteroides sp. 51]|uniref:hypothetical protein n=1 Tax=Bacteroides sp. 51 TaxID=2302938 RepID=UPI0013D51382|nr:hypothetical protein [Bacteroides sp. 51]